MTAIADDLRDHWNAICPFLSIHDEQEYERAVELLNNLIDEIGTNEQHPLYEFLDTLGTVIHSYEERHYPIPDCSGVDMVRFFMEEHDLAESELPEIGSPCDVSKILNGKKDLSLAQVRALAERFHVSSAVFI